MFVYYKSLTWTSKWISYLSTHLCSTYRLTHISIKICGTDIYAPIILWHTAKIRLGGSRQMCKNMLTCIRTYIIHIHIRIYVCYTCIYTQQSMVKPFNWSNKLHLSYIHHRLNFVQGICLKIHSSLLCSVSKK